MVFSSINFLITLLLIAIIIASPIAIIHYLKEKSRFERKAINELQQQLNEISSELEKIAGKH